MSRTYIRHYPISAQMVGNKKQERLKIERMSLVARVASLEARLNFAAGYYRVYRTPTRADAQKAITEARLWAIAGREADHPQTCRLYTVLITL